MRKRKKKEGEEEEGELAGRRTLRKERRKVEKGGKVKGGSEGELSRIAL